uniref:LAGLIDADG_2 domain-containing protein n=1 Tax=Caenorhabditis tropicalis TaxID=1561998 RepID=A0A1I7UKV4_9PELO
MSDRRKYALNGVGFFENAQEHMERNNFPRIPIGTIGSVNGWYLTMEQKIINNEGKYHPFIYTRETKPTVKIRHFLGFLKNNGLSDSPYEYSGDLVPVFGPCGRQKTVDELILAYYDVLKYAQKYKLFNVIRLLDQLMVLNEDEVRDIYPHAILFDLKHCLPKFLKAQKTSKELAEPLKRLDLKTMTTGEVMKKCVKRFFEF